MSEDIEREIARFQSWAIGICPFFPFSSMEVCRC